MTRKTMSRRAALQGIVGTVAATGVFSIGRRASAAGQALSINTALATTDPLYKGLEAMQANAKAAYVFAIQQRIQSRWVRPPTATDGLECIVNIRQAPGGEVLSVSIGRCNGDETVRRSIENAVKIASPLPMPEDPSVFE